MAWLARAFTWFLGLFPREARLALGRGLGSLAYGLGIRRRVALDNLALAFPEKPERERRRIARAAYLNLGAGILDFVGSSPAELERLLIFDGFDLFEKLYAEKKGVVVASAHLGSWETLAAAGAQRGVPLHLVTQSLRGGANQEAVATRARSGLREIPARGALRAGVKLLRQGHVVVNLLDQNMLPKRGIFVDFFGVPACTTPAASLMAKRTGAPTILAVALNEPDGRVRLHVEGPFEMPDTGKPARDVREHTQQLVRAIERLVRERPEQWLWLHRRWKTRPRPS